MADDINYFGIDMENIRGGRFNRYLFLAITMFDDPHPGTSDPIVKSANRFKMSPPDRFVQCPIVVIPILFLS